MPSAATRLLLRLMQATRGGVSYLLRDEFTTTASAPLTSSRTSEPGPGTLTITDTANRLSIASGALTIAPSATAFIVNSAAIARAAGLAVSMVVQRPPSGTNVPVNFGVTDNSGNPQYASFLINNSINNDGIYVNGGFLIQPVVDYTTIEKYVIIERAAGAFFIIRVADHNYLVWVDDTVANASPLVTLRSSSASVAASSHTADSLIATQLTGNWATLYGMATATNTTPTDGSTLTGGADGLIEFKWTPASSEVMTIEFRKTDDSNLFKLVCDQAGGTIKLYRRQAGVDTELNTGKTQTWTVGTARRICIMYHDNIIRTVVANTPKHNTTDSFNTTATGVKVSGFATGSNLICWPWEVSLPSPFDSSSHVAFVTYGDSKTASGTWQSGLASALTTASGRTWFNTTVAHSAQ